MAPLPLLLLLILTSALIVDSFRLVPASGIWADAVNKKSAYDYDNEPLSLGPWLNSYSGRLEKRANFLNLPSMM